MTKFFRRPRKRPLLVIGVLCLLTLPAVTGCDSNPTFPSTPAFGLIKVFNSTATDIATLRCRHSGTGQSAEIWSYNLLSTLPALPGYLIFTLQPFGGWAQLRLPPGTYDFFLQSTDGNTFWIEPDLVIEKDQITTYTLN